MMTRRAQNQKEERMFHAGDKVGRFKVNKYIGFNYYGKVKPHHLYECTCDCGTTTKCTQSLLKYKQKRPKSGCVVCNNQRKVNAEDRAKREIERLSRSTGLTDLDVTTMNWLTGRRGFYEYSD